MAGFFLVFFWVQDNASRVRNNARLARDDAPVVVGGLIVTPGVFPL
jgi:hypothetical protein